MSEPTPLPSELAELRGLIFRTFASEGRPPSIAEAARRLSRPQDAIKHDLAELHARHLIVLSADGDAIRMAHPFSAAPMGFVVRAGDERWWGGCTWDSFGIAAALDREVRIETTCPLCLAEHHFDAGPTRPPEPPLVARFPLPAARWWDDVVWSCTRIRTFCSGEHGLEFAGRSSEEPGQLIPLAVLWSLALPWYGDRLDPDYAPRSRQRSQALLVRAGLVGEFWDLP